MALNNQIVFNIFKYNIFVIKIGMRIFSFFFMVLDKFKINVIKYSENLLKYVKYKKKYSKNTKKML